jgi:hypothetical protein
MLRMKMPNLGLFLMLLSCLFQLLGCSKVEDSSELVGRYEAHHKNGAETLDLRSDGTYVHRIKMPNGTELESSANWKFDPYGGEPKVFLEHFTQHFPGSSRSNPMDTLLGAERKWGTIRLYLSYDRDLFYAKSMSN